MNVLQICTFARGGAGKSAFAYHRELIRGGINSNILFRAATQQETSIHSIDEVYGTTATSIRNLKHKLYRKYKLFSKPKSPERYSFAVSPFDITRHPAYQAADLIHLHWTYELLDIPSFLKNNTKPVIWTQHDECILLDGCHCAYGFPFDAYKDYSLVFRGHIHQFLDRNSVYLTAPSTWLTNRLKEDTRTNNTPVHLVPNGLETKIFNVKDQSTARQSLGLPVDKKIVLFIADFLDRPLKGLDPFVKMIHELKATSTTDNYLFVIVGHGTVEGLDIPLEFRHIPYVESSEKMSQLYNAADVYVTPTFADNLPYTVMESLFCGTPVAAFDVGGVSDMITHKENGLLCEVGDVSALAQHVLSLVSESKYRSREMISEAIQRKYSIELVTPMLIELYRKVLSESATA